MFAHHYSKASNSRGLIWISLGFIHCHNQAKSRLWHTQSTGSVVAAAGWTQLKYGREEICGLRRPAHHTTGGPGSATPATSHPMFQQIPLFSVECGSGASDQTGSRGSAGIAVEGGGLSNIVWTLARTIMISAPTCPPHQCINHQSRRQNWLHTRHCEASRWSWRLVLNNFFECKQEIF